MLMQVAFPGSHLEVSVPCHCHTLSGQRGNHKAALLGKVGL